MDESVNKGVELNADSRKSRYIRRVCVEGYNTWLAEYDVNIALRKHFSSCGEITHVYIPRKDYWGPLNRFAFIYFPGEEEEAKALKLDGSDAGGWIVKAKPYPFDERSLYSELEPMMRATGQWLGRRMSVTGFDTSLSEDNVKRMLSEHFCSSGEATTQVVPIPHRNNGDLHRNAILHIRGEDAVEKALELSGRDVGGLNFVVNQVLPPFKREKISSFLTKRPLPDK